MGPCLAFNNTKTCWAIQINNKPSYVHVGISLKSLTVKSNYLFSNASNIGHGHYLMFSAGSTYSHSDGSYNNVYDKSFEFVAGDRIFMEFDSANQILRFRKNRSAKKFELKVVGPQNDSYCPSVCMYKVGGSVTLLDGEHLS